MKKRNFTACMRQHKDHVFSQAYYFTGNQADAAEITQEVFMRLWMNIEKIKKRSVKSWLLTVTRNCCIDNHRKKREYNQSANNYDGDENLYEPLDLTNNPERKAIRKEFRDQINQALLRLPPMTRLAVILREIHQLSYREVAETLNLPLNTVKVYLHRGKKNMAVYLRQHLTRDNVNELSRL